MASSSSSSSVGGGWQPAAWLDEPKMSFYLQPIVSSDPEDRQQKIAFWTAAFRAFQTAAAASSHLPAHATRNNQPTFTDTAAATSSLSFTLQEVQKGMARRGEISPTLEAVLCQMLAQDEIRRADSYASSPAKASTRAKVANYLWSWVSPTKPTTRLPPGRYVLVEQVDAAAQALVSQLQQASTDVFTLEQLQQISGRSQADVLLLIQQLNLAGVHPLTEVFAPEQPELALASSPKRVFKFGSPVTAVDHSRALLADTIRTMRAQALEKERYIEEREKEARRLLVLKRKTLALTQLQMKKRCMVQLETLHSQLENLDLLVSHLEQSISQQAFFNCMKQANQTLKQMQDVSVDSVADLADELSERMEQVQLTEDALAQPVSSSLGDVDVDAEYAAMLAELEREAQQAEAPVITQPTIAAPTTTAVPAPTPTKTARPIAAASKLLAFA